MVMRKPVPPNTNIVLGSDKSEPPQPATPNVTGVLPPPSDRKSHRGSPNAAAIEPDSYAAWRSESAERDGLPTALRPGSGRQSMEGSHNSAEDLPESLRVGPPGYTPRSSNEMQRPTAATTNPYLRQQTDWSDISEGRKSSVNTWGVFSEIPPLPSSAPPPPPIPKDTPPKEKFANLSLGEQNTNPWQPSFDVKPLPKHPQPPSIERQDSGNEAWSTASGLLPPSRPAPGIAPPPALVTIPSEGSPAWDDENSPPSQANLTPSSEVLQPHHEEGNAWQEVHGWPQQEQPGLEVREAQEQYFRSDGDWESDLQAQESGIIETAPSLPARRLTDGRAPELPPRPSQEGPASRPSVRTENSASSVIGSGAAAKRPKKETYEIKKVAWYDATAKSNPRISPILVQNANGPCPLLALVNALTLTTPADVNTALVEALRSREQVSLGLLLDAVFDELMSGRRGGAAQELPDVGDLYAFLITLHTGMNVNPRFFPPAPTDSADDPRRSMSHVHPTEREEAIPGTFEETREMRLYSTFSVPLIHGWLPPRDSPAYTALARSAKTYEDAQNLMFREEELEDKLLRGGLSFEEQSTLEDISTIKAFFNESATQLTPYGLDIISKSMAPGSVAILFRNDHFSTLYRHPESYQLLHLVTDMGYAGHEEVVWESLVDVNGENCEFFSGDFRIVGNAPVEARQSVDNSDWTTVSHRSSRNRNSLQAHNSPITQRSEAIDQAPLSPNTEQEDHDLALALQLQDEEEQRHQEEMARRHREAELSQQYIEQQASQHVANQVPVTTRGGRGGRSQGRSRGSSRGAAELRPAIPPRRNNAQAPTVPPAVDPEAGVDAPPPSYEQAATEPSYIPPIDHPAHPSASADGQGRRTSAYAANSAAYNSQPSQTRLRGGRVNSVGSRPGALINEVQNPPPRRQTGGLTHQQAERDKECIVM